MSAYPDRNRTALMVIDVQVDVMEYAWKREETISRIAELVRRARESKVDVIWVQHSDDGMQIDSEAWQLVPELKVLNSERIVHKLWRSSFEETELEEILEELKVGHLVITGAQSNLCVRHTIHAAIERGLDITLVSDAHTTLDDSWNGAPIPAELIVAELNRGCSDYELPDSFVDTKATELIAF